MRAGATAFSSMGRTVLEFTYEDVNDRGAYVLSTLKAAGVSRS